MSCLSLLTEEGSHVHRAAQYLGVGWPCVAGDFDSAVPPLSLLTTDLRKQVIFLARVVHHDVIIVRTALVIEELRGFPGALTGPVLKVIGWPGLLTLAEGKRAESQGVAAVRQSSGQREPGRVIWAEGRVTGTIVQPVGESEFASYDCIFMPDGVGRTYAQLDWDEYFRLVGGAAMLSMKALLAKLEAVDG